MSSNATPENSSINLGGDREQGVFNTQPRSTRFGTLVWGLILTAGGVGALLWAHGIRFEFAIAAAIALGVGGVTLIGAAIMSAARSSSAEPSAKTPPGGPGEGSEITGAGSR